MKVLDQRIMTNQEVYLAVTKEIADQNAQEEDWGIQAQSWLDFLSQQGLAAGQIAGQTNTDVIAQMLEELNEGFPQLTKMDKFNLVNLPEAEAIIGQSAESATLCDICLAVPSVKETLTWDDVVNLCEVVAKYKRVSSN